VRCTEQHPAVGRWVGLHWAGLVERPGTGQWDNLHQAGPVERPGTGRRGNLYRYFPYVIALLWSAPTGGRMKVDLGHT
jgi:hypothetical protein